MEVEVKSVESRGKQKAKDGNTAAVDGGDKRVLLNCAWGVAQAFDLAGSPTQWGGPSFAYQGTLEPNFRPPFDRISDPQIPLTSLKKWSSCRFSVSRTTI